ncbi:response regulator [Humidisolicoccus flavus]|uniref:response regulator n=1 Tax=Humidisolicoccus flavus TaxID=3111414 RepID=UPI003252FCF4
MIRVLLVDDQTLVRQGIRSLLEIATGFEVVGEASDGAEALEIAKHTRPDVILLDLRMPRFDGIWALESLRDQGIAIPVLVLTTFDDDEFVLRALQAGAKGYLLKDVSVTQLADAIHTLAAGQSLVQPSITDQLLRAIRSRPDREQASQPATLTEREHEVLRLMAEGYSNRQIAAALFLAEGTVKNHVSVILQKIGASDRTNAVLRALRNGTLQ